MTTTAREPFHDHCRACGGTYSAGIKPARNGWLSVAGRARRAREGDGQVSDMKKPGIYGRATSMDGERTVISATRRAEYEASVERLREAARPCVQLYGTHAHHGIDCATPDEWDRASDAVRRPGGEQVSEIDEAIKEARSEAVEDRRIGDLMHQRRNRDAMYRRAEVVERIAGELEDATGARDALAVVIREAREALTRHAAQMTDDAYDDIRSVLYQPDAT